MMGLMSYHDFENCKNLSTEWFTSLRDSICREFEAIEGETGYTSVFNRSEWTRPGGGGGQMSIMRGEVFEKVGVNFSTVYGNFSPQFAKEIPGTDESGGFWASGVSVVAHMKNPFVPAIHMNTRFIVTTKAWFGGGTDLTPTFEHMEDTEDFHDTLRETCNEFDPLYYPHFKQQCDDYFYLPHRKERRGIGGIFFDYLNTGNWEKDFGFIQSVGKAFIKVYGKIVRRNMHKTWTQQDKEKQLLKRGRYVEFNLLYDRGTRFGLMTDGNTEAILMSLPPEAKW
jgi:coproporphyrinogen III oxidase